VRAWSATLPSASSIGSSDGETVFDHTESSVTDTFSVAESSAEISRPAGPRHSERVYYLIATMI
jgi:hypothetical protein